MDDELVWAAMNALVSCCDRSLDHNACCLDDVDLGGLEEDMVKFAKVGLSENSCKCVLCECWVSKVSVKEP